MLNHVITFFDGYFLVVFCSIFKSQYYEIVKFFVVILRSALQHYIKWEWSDFQSWSLFKKKKKVVFDEPLC